MDLHAASGIIDWEHLTGQSRFVIDIISIPIFSAIAGLITNWTGVIMLFSPSRFTGFRVPGLQRIFPLLPRKVQILPIFAPGGILGFQGFVPCRAEKMASLFVDTSISQIGSISDFYAELDVDQLADGLAVAAQPDVKRLATEIVETRHPQLWRSLPGSVRQDALDEIERELPTISRRAFAKIGEHIDQLLDIKLMAVGYMRREPEVLKEILMGMAAPELRFMVRVGALGFFFGIPLALYLSLMHYTGPEAIERGGTVLAMPDWAVSVLHFVPAWLVVLIGAALIGVLVNIIAVKVVFEPGEPQPRYKYLWKQSKVARRQHEAAADLARMMALRVLTVENFAHELLYGASADKTRYLIEQAVGEEADRVIGPIMTLARKSFGLVDVAGIERRVATELLDFAPALYEPELTAAQAARIEEFSTEKLRQVPPTKFGEMLYAAIEQDAWLLYVHGGLLGIVVGAFHILIFGA